MRILTLFTMVMVARYGFGQPVVYPLHIGDRWEYDWVGETAVLNDTTFSDTTFGKERIYSVFNPEIYRLHYSPYHRQDGDQVFIIDPETGFEELLFDFSVAVGDTVNSILYGSGDTTLIILQRYRIAPIFGLDRRVWSFLVDPYPYIADIGWVVEVVDSIGLYSLATYLESYALVGAILNGVQYGEITSVEDPLFLSNAADLHQNYPNPFNPSTTIRFSIPKSAEVSLKIFNLLGEEVATLVSGIRDAGAHTVQWDATGQPSGVYFYQLQAGEFVETRKLVLIR